MSVYIPPLKMFCRRTSSKHLLHYSETYHFAVEPCQSSVGSEYGNTKPLFGNTHNIFTASSGVYKTNTIRQLWKLDDMKERVHLQDLEITFLGASVAYYPTRQYRDYFPDHHIDALRVFTIHYIFIVLFWKRLFPLNYLFSFITL